MTAQEEVKHPVFATWFGFGSRMLTPAQVRFRQKFLSGLAGRVIEIGPGAGVNFAFYPPAVTEVLAVEPEPDLRRQALAAAQKAPVPVTVVAGVAEDLPAGDESCDGAVSSLVLCTVRDPTRALAEIRRVLKPGGTFCYYEHVIAQSSAGALLQRMIDRAGIQQFVAGGCHCSRNTGAAIRAAGFDVVKEKRVTRPLTITAAPQIIGTATRA